MTDYRIETDSLGKVKVAASAYYGAQTQRAMENFPISGRRMPREFVRAMGIIKCAAAKANMSLGLLDQKIGKTIVRAANEIVDAKFDHEFVVDVYQTGSGTSTNMNTNEIISNRAIELLGGKIGSKTPIHPNDHVNKCQSSNGVIPSAIHISALECIEKNLLPALNDLHDALSAKGRQFHKVLKIGRTHLQDALPILLGQEFSGYAAQIQHGIRRIKGLRRHFRELALGRTAIGTGLNAPKEFGPLTIKKISEFTGIPFTPADNPFEAIAARDAVVEASSQLKTIAVSLMKIVNDLRWMSSGPRCGFEEITIPTLQPGSSAMPGKVNPVILESVMMICATVMGNDVAITIGGQHGNFELNTMMPMMANHLLESIQLLANGLRNLVDRCVNGIKANEGHIGSLIEESLALGTALIPIIGYDAAANIVKDANATGKTIRQVLRERKVLPEKELSRVLNPTRLTKPGIIST